jgi:hypothetical protein
MKMGDDEADWKTRLLDTLSIIEENRLS